MGCWIWCISTWDALASFLLIGLPIGMRCLSCSLIFLTISISLPNHLPSILKLIRILLAWAVVTLLWGKKRKLVVLEYRLIQILRIINSIHWNATKLDLMLLWQGIVFWEGLFSWAQLYRQWQWLDNLQMSINFTETE